MKINLFQDYRGRLTGDRLLPHGVIEVSDEFGRYLISKGYASEVNAGLPVSYEPDFSTDVVVHDDSDMVTYADVNAAIAEQIEADSDTDEPRAFGGKRRGR